MYRLVPLKILSREEGNVSFNDSLSTFCLR